jgi:predicted AlkP superfamily pyrophosphatase or phosphodiesterase
LLTGELPNRHGIVANGWLFRDTNEVRFWQQSNALLNAEPVYATARRRAAERGRSFKSAKLFWWFNQGAAVDLAVTPKPHYGIDGSKFFDIATTPPELGERIKRSLGPFPFANFWGPMSGERSTQWIAAAAALTVLEDRPDLTFVYLPHLDYEPQRRGTAGCDMARHVGELDRACAPLLEAARAVGARVWVVSEYGHVDVTTPVYINRVLRRAGLLEVRPGPFGEQLDLYTSRAYAVCDHQLAHIYVREPEDRPRVVELLRGLSGVDGVFAGDEQAELALDHSRSGEVVVLSRRDSWFAYPFWLDDRNAPDYARCVAIHHKPGFDPCELFFDPAKWLPKLRVAGKLARKTLGFRMKMDVIPLDAAIVRGSHGLAATDDADRPIWIGDGDRQGIGPIPMTVFRPAVLEALGLGE